MGILQLCQQYITIISEISHESNINRQMVLCGDRRDMHNLILSKFRFQRTNEILNITDNLDRLNVRGFFFDLSKDYTEKMLDEYGRQLMISLEMFGELNLKQITCVTLIECVTNHMKNFTEGNTYEVYQEDENYIYVLDDNNMEYGVDKELEIPITDINNYNYEFRTVY